MSESTNPSPNPLAPQPPTLETVVAERDAALAALAQVRRRLEALPEMPSRTPPQPQPRAAGRWPTPVRPATPPDATPSPDAVRLAAARAAESQNPRDLFEYLRLRRR